MKDFLEYVIAAIVNHPEDVIVKETVDDKQNLVNLELSVHAEDMGRIIGKQGKTIKAIRNLLRILGVKNNKRIKFDLVEKGAPPASPASITAAASPDLEIQPPTPSQAPKKTPTKISRKSETIIKKEVTPIEPES